MPQSFKHLDYDGLYLWWRTDGMKHQDLFDSLRLGAELKTSARLCIMGIGYRKTELTEDASLGFAAAQIEGIHRRGQDGQRWFIFGRFRNSEAPPGWGVKTGGAWDDAFFFANYDQWSNLSLLVTSKNSLMPSPLKDYEKELGG